MANLGLAFAAGAAKSLNENINKDNEWNKRMAEMTYKNAYEEWSDQNKFYTQLSQLKNMGAYGKIAEIYGVGAQYQKDPAFQEKFNGFVTEKGDAILSQLNPGEKPNINNWRDYAGPNKTVARVKEMFGFDPMPAYSKGRADSLHTQAIEEEKQDKEALMAPAPDVPYQNPMTKALEGYYGEGKVPKDVQARVDSYTAYQASKGEKVNMDHFQQVMGMAADDMIASQNKGRWYNATWTENGVTYQGTVDAGSGKFMFLKKDTKTDLTNINENQRMMAHSQIMNMANSLSDAEKKGIFWDLMTSKGEDYNKPQFQAQNNVYYLANEWMKAGVTEGEAWTKAIRTVEAGVRGDQHWFSGPSNVTFLPIAASDLPEGVRDKFVKDFASPDKLFMNPYDNLDGQSAPGASIPQPKVEKQQEIWGVDRNGAVKQYTNEQDALRAREAGVGLFKDRSTAEVAASKLKNPLKKFDDEQKAYEKSLTSVPRLTPQQNPLTRGLQNKMGDTPSRPDMYLR